MADLLEQLGDIPPFRIRLRPPPGEATERDVLALHDHEDRLFETSKSNTKAEMARKRREYFAAGCSLVWIVDPDARNVAVFTSEEQSLLLNENDQLSAENLLPGFHLSIRELFSRLDRQAN